MLITVDLAASYDWEPSSEPADPADVLALRAKPGIDGTSLRRVTKPGPTHTSIGLPETELANLDAHFERVGAPKTRERIVAWMLEEKIMPHHAHPSDWRHIAVHEEPAVESFLNLYFNLKG